MSEANKGLIFHLSISLLISSPTGCMTDNSIILMCNIGFSYSLTEAQQV